MYSFQPRFDLFFDLHFPECTLYIKECIFLPETQQEKMHLNEPRSDLFFDLYNQTGLQTDQRSF